MPDWLTIGMTALAIVGGLWGLTSGYSTYKRNTLRRLQVRIIPDAETVTIDVCNAGNNCVPLAGVELLVDGAVLPLDSLTEGHFPCDLDGGKRYRLPVTRTSLDQVLAGQVGDAPRIRAAATDGNGRTHKSRSIRL